VGNSRWGMCFKKRRGVNGGAERGEPPDSCIDHSDRAVQYASQTYVEELNRAGMTINIAGKGNPCDDAFAESFNKMLKYEEVYLWANQTVDDVKERISCFLENVYNNILHIAGHHILHSAARCDINFPTG